MLQNVRLSQPVQNVTARPQNYDDVVKLQNMDRSLMNTMLVTILVVGGQLTTSVLGGYAFARLKFPGRDVLFVLYLGTMMIPFVVLITPLYQMMVSIGWVDRLAALVMPWMFTAYGTFLMRQAFLTMPKEIEEAALMDGASRWQILLRIFVPATVPALATLATFTFLYAWNSFFWPLVDHQHGQRSQPRADALAQRAARPRFRLAQLDSGGRGHLDHSAGFAVHSGAALLCRKRHQSGVKG